MKLIQIRRDQKIQRLSRDQKISPTNEQEKEKYISSKKASKSFDNDSNKNKRKNKKGRKSYYMKTIEYIKESGKPYQVGKRTPSDGNCFYYALLEGLKKQPDLVKMPILEQ